MHVFVMLQKLGLLAWLRAQPTRQKRSFTKNKSKTTSVLQHACFNKKKDYFRNEALDITTSRLIFGRALSRCLVKRSGGKRQSVHKQACLFITLLLMLGKIAFPQVLSICF